MQLPLKQKQQLPNRHHIQSSSQPQRPRRTSSLTPGLQFHLWNSSKTPPASPVLARVPVLSALNHLECISSHNNNWKSKSRGGKKITAGLFKAIIFFWWAIDFGNGVFMVREGSWWSSFALASKSSRASCPVLLWCLRAEFGLAWVSALEGLFIFSGAGCCVMRIPSHSICLRRSNSLAVWAFEMFRSRLEIGTTIIFKVDQNCRFSLITLHEGRCSILL